jgi:signal transduction histidine kinase
MTGEHTKTAMHSRTRFAAPARLLALFLVLSGVPLAALGWLGTRVVEQDRALQAQRVRERLDTAGALLARELDRALSAWEETLPHAAVSDDVPLPAESVLLVLGPNGVLQQKGALIAYLPAVGQPGLARTDLFTAADASEFRDHDLTRAIAIYRQYSSSGNSSTRAEALMRLARCLRKAGHTREALRVYDDLSTMGAEVVAGSPAHLVARRERIVLLDEMGDRSAADRERAQLTSAVLSGRFRIDRSTFEFFRNTAQVPNAPSRTLSDAPARMAQAVETFWPRWQEQASGRAVWTSESGAFATVWRRVPAGTVTLTGGIDGLATSMVAAMQNLHVRAALSDQSGHFAWGRAAEPSGVTKRLDEIGLPWTLSVSVADSAASGAVDNARRNLFIAAFALMALVAIASGYFVFRAVNRELRVARLQSDFVAAVSHEFRTPLTAMRHLTDILEEGGAPAVRLPEYYGALARETRRLHTMVENLLDFGRMDSGRRSYEFVESDADAILAKTVQEFADRSQSAANRIVKLTPAEREDADCVVRADREALALAIRNLVDNALKYSPDQSSVRVSAAMRDGSVAIAVEDQGSGIPEHERREIFRKFVRGVAARRLNIKGTGIGLTMAEQIVKAHGGHLELTSEVGRGSRFTIVLPAVCRP